MNEQDLNYFNEYENVLRNNIEALERQLRRNPDSIHIKNQIKRQKANLRKIQYKRNKYYKEQKYKSINI